MTARLQDALARLHSLLADGGPYQIDTVVPPRGRTPWPLWLGTIAAVGLMVCHAAGVGL